MLKDSIQALMAKVRRGKSRHTNGDNCTSIALNRQEAMQCDGKQGVGAIKICPEEWELTAAKITRFESHMMGV
jgi:hypothetical protein